METKLKSMKCKKCKTIVENVGEKAKKVTCDECIQKELDKAIKEQEEESTKINETQTFIKSKHLIKLNKKENKKMANEKTSNTLSCSKCGSIKKADKKRIEKYLGKEYFCRACRKQK